jgi:ATP-dependent DNA ligase
METKSVEQIPAGESWQYEPKWDGFRCIAFRNGDDVYLQSKAGQPLARYFPDVVEAIGKLPAKNFVLDGELAVPVGGALSFDELQLRLHPAASRVQKLAQAHPAIFIVFDLLAQDRQSYLKKLLRDRRKSLETFARKNFKSTKSIRLSPATTKLEQAKRWFEKVGGDLDGVIAKQLEAAYASGERTAAVKIKQIRSADCVIGGFRYASGAKILGSLLLGLYDDDDGLLHHVGFTSAFKTSERRALTKKFEALRKAPGFTGNAPGGPSRWSTERTGEWEPVDPKIVVEVAYDHFTGGRFRHGTKILRWRMDKFSRQCTMDQVAGREGKSLALL